MAENIQHNSRNYRNIRKKLLPWFSRFQRLLPWRENRNWYTVWVSEVMLQQTRVEQVIPFFNRFMKAFPDVWKLADAPRQNVLKLWQGLGYYSRAGNMHRAAQIIVDTYHGRLPETLKEVRRLPGFGEYTGRSVLSLAFNQPLAVVDGNVKRVLARLFADETDTRPSASNRHFQILADRLLDRDHPAVFNEAMMELGALVCTPSNPGCNSCPLQLHCRAHSHGETAKFPVRSAAPAKRVVHSICAIIICDNKLLLARKPDKGLLGGMWEFPQIEITPVVDSGNRPDNLRIMKKIPQAVYLRKLQYITHTYTHFRAIVHPLLLNVEKEIELVGNGYSEIRWTVTEQLKKYPLPGWMLKLIKRESELLKIIADGNVKKIPVAGHVSVAYK